VGIVYVTDVTADIEPAVATVFLPRADNVIATYPIAVVAGSEQRGTAASFVAYVRGRGGQDVLRSSGFLPPP
jgi:molybdate transport system substrate-binding protein